MIIEINPSINDLEEYCDRYNLTLVIDQDGEHTWLARFRGALDISGELAGYGDCPLNAVFNYLSNIAGHSAEYLNSVSTIKHLEVSDSVRKRLA